MLNKAEITDFAVSTLDLFWKKQLF